MVVKTRVGELEAKKNEGLWEYGVALEIEREDMQACGKKQEDIKI